MKSLLLALLFLPVMVFAENAPPPVAPKESVASKLESTVISFLDATQNAGNKLSDAAGKVIDFASNEIPLVIKEYLNWHFAVSLIWFSTAILVLITAGFLFYKNVVKMWNDKWSTGYRQDTPTDVGLVGVMTIVLTMICLVFCPIIAANNLDWLKISIAPRVYLIDQFQHLAK